MARGDLSPLDVARFVQAAGARLQDGARLAVPLACEWRFAAALGAEPPRDPPSGRRLRTGRPSPIGLHDMLGVVWQLCAVEGAPALYAALGGGHRTRFATPDSSRTRTSATGGDTATLAPLADTLGEATVTLRSGSARAGS